jgi:hypothetical protein
VPLDGLILDVGAEFSEVLRLVTLLGALLHLLGNDKHLGTPGIQEFSNGRAEYAPVGEQAFQRLLVLIWEVRKDLTRATHRRMTTVQVGV